MTVLISDTHNYDYWSRQARIATETYIYIYAYIYIVSESVKPYE